MFSQQLMLVMLWRLFTCCVMLKNEEKVVHQHTSSRPKEAVPRHPEEYKQAELFQIPSIHTPKTLEHCVGLLGSR